MPMKISERFAAMAEVPTQIKAITVISVSAVIIAVIAVESGGNPQLKGSAGEIGLMQLTQAALTDVNNYYGFVFSQADLKNPIPNILAGTVFLRMQYHRMGNWYDAIRAYNAGEAGAKSSPTKSKTYAEKVNFYWNIAKSQGY